ncbi:hypothetical protein CEXT_320681 [Caerostris extrusa]|uniref:Uncharacterized protein n=1 Tax=Caerostris extrusa TaxID=172846 RepID=A0AAV4V376_CAEEX|nr:hypothetical protein CEXT_320681 [Caerostris extrusa]
MLSIALPNKPSLLLLIFEYKFISVYHHKTYPPPTEINILFFPLPQSFRPTFRSCGGRQPHPIAFGNDLYLHGTLISQPMKRFNLRSLYASIPTPFFEAMA